ncbi:sensor histidine kinase [Mucilaginibacter glaciei]|uniref:histidine kinase n=1 Tax=Mucilaginibacter glaciei TaxID=2772109 RepID=A0A926NVD2_9SPHI|nr:ATP-binding protein [Mucilaginibacter glaciei]MBD1395257.1 HAMP domain-containing histidine kinase [Mucilaginibacter glaciei]
MSIATSESHVQRMLSIIYQIPMGLIEADMEGSITSMNAKSVQLLMPLFYSHGFRGNNINELLQVVAPDILEQVSNFTRPNGNIIKQQRQEIALQSGRDEGNEICLLFTVDKLDANSLTYIFDDVTELYNKEKQLKQMMQDNATEQLNKFEIASGLLHDIGNAVVGFGSYITKIKRSIEQKNDISSLDNLKGFIEKNQAAIGGAIGEKKANAITDLLNGVIANQENNLTDVRTSITDQMKIISHIQEILNIQRQYVKGHYIERASVNLRDLVNDAVSMLANTFEKRGISFSLELPAGIVHIKGDRTKLMQVFLNLLKNSVDSVMHMADENTLKQIRLILGRGEGKVAVRIQDNGKGFDQATGAKLFTRGYTTKTEGTGLGLVNCKSIIEGHNGTITLTSAGEGKGATCTVIFYL